MNGKKPSRTISLILAAACIFALVAGIAGFSNGMAGVNGKKDAYTKLEARLDELSGTMDTVQQQKADYDALKADYDAALEEYDEQLTEHQAVKKDFEGSVLDYNQGLIGDAGLEQLTMALALSSNVNMEWDRNELSKSKSAYERGLKEYEAAKKTYDEANTQLQNGRYAYQQGLGQFDEAKKQIASGQRQYDIALAAYNSSYSLYKRITDGLAMIEKYGVIHRLALRTISGQIGQEITDNFIAEVKARFEEAQAQLNEIGAQIDQAKAIVANGEGQIAAAGAQLNEGEAQLREMKQKLDAGLVELNAAKEILDSKAPDDPRSSTPPEEALPEDSELRKAQIALAKLERISSIDGSLMDTPEGLDQASALVKKNEITLNNFKVGLDSAKKQLDVYEALEAAVQRGSEQLANEGYGTKGDSASNIIEAAYTVADEQKADYSRTAFGNTASLILMLISAAGAVLTLVWMNTKPERASVTVFVAAGAAVVAMLLRRFAILSIIAVLLMAAAAVLLVRSRKEA